MIILRGVIMDKTKKILMIISLSALAAACLMLILAVFKLPIFEGIPLRVLLIISTICVSTAISISEVTIIKKRKVLGYIGLGLLAISVLFALIIFCSSLLYNYSVFNRITGIISVLSVTFIIIISIYSKLGKSILGLQIPTYICLSLFSILICILIGGVALLDINGMLEVIIVMAIICFGLLLASIIVAARKKEVAVSANEEMITITKTEYENLKKENEELKNQIQNLKQQ